MLLIACGSCAAQAQLNKPYFYVKGRDYIVDGRYREAIESLNLLLRSEQKEYEGYFLRGVAKYNLDDLQGALQDFSLAIEYNPIYTLAFQYRGITRSRLGLYDQALADFARALEMRPNFAGAYYSRAVTYFLNQQFDNSVKDYNSFLRIEPRDPSAHVNRGTAKLYLRDTVAAMNDYNRAVAINPYFEDSYLRRGLLQLVQGKTELGIHDMDRALELDSTMAIAYFYRAMGYNTLGKISLALDNFDRSIEYDGTNSVAIFNRALMRSQIGDYNRAIDDYTKVAQQNPQNVLVFYNRAAVYAELGAVDNAIADYTRAIELYPDFANAYLFRSSLRALKMDRKGSMSDRRTAENLISEYRGKISREGFEAFADTSKRMSSIMSFDADFDKDNLKRLASNSTSRLRGRPMYRFVINPDADTVVGYDPRRYGNARLDKFVRGGGVQGLMLDNNLPTIGRERLLELDSTYATGEFVSQVFVRGITQTLLQQYSNAINLFSYVISENPTEPFAYINRATTQVETIEFMSSLSGDYQNMASDADPASRLKASAARRDWDFSTAVSDMKQVVALMPELPHAHYNLGYIYTKMGDIPAAVQAYSRAIELFPYFADAYYNRAILQLMIDEKQKGCMDLSRAGELGIADAYTILSNFEL